MLGSVTVPATWTLARHSLFMPRPVTVSRLGAVTPSASRHGATRRIAGSPIVADPVDLAHVEARHLRRRGRAAEPEAARGQAHVARDRAAVAVRADGEIAGHRRLDVVAVEQPRAFGMDVDVHADALGRGEIERARARARCRRPRCCR